MPITSDFKDNGYSSLALKRQRQAAAARRRNGTPSPRRNGTPRTLKKQSGPYCRKSRTPRTPRNIRFSNCGTQKSLRFSNCGTPMSPKFKTPATLSHVRTGHLGQCHHVSPSGRRCPETPRVATAPARPTTLAVPEAPELWCVTQGVYTDSEDSICFSICEEVLEESSPSPAPSACTERPMPPVREHSDLSGGSTLSATCTTRCCVFYTRGGAVSCKCKMCRAPATPSWTGGPSTWSYPG